MSKKPFIIIILSILIAISITIAYFLLPLDIDSEESIPVVEVQKVLTVKEEKQLAVKEKIQRIRKKVALKWLIIKWDENFNNQEYTQALTKYLQIHKTLPEDVGITQKVWEIYFQLGRFAQSYRYLRDNIWKSKSNPSLIAKGLIFANYEKNTGSGYIKEELDSIPLNSQEAFYYYTSVSCLENYKDCKTRFSDTYKENSWSGIVFAPLKNINNALKNFDNFQSKDENYKDALLAAAYYQNGLYPLAITVSEHILSKQNDYIPVLKITAKSYYELWNYKEAKKYLNLLNKIDNNDPEVSYFLWIVQEKLHEYLLSIIHFQNAIASWAKNSIDIRKRLVYSYYELWENEKMLTTLLQMAQKNRKQLSIPDYNLILFYLLLNDRFKYGEVVSTNAIEDFPESELFYAYNSWAHLEKENPDIITIDSQVQKSLEINNKNPLVLFVQGKVEIYKGNSSRWFVLFKKLWAYDKSWEFVELAKNELLKIEQQKLENNSNNQNNNGNWK